MIFIWLSYLILSIVISFLLSFLVSRKFAKVLIFSFTLSVTISLWFKSPGENILAPIFSIFLLESTILDNNGFFRIIRPFIFVFLLSLTISFFFWKDDTKN